MIAPEPKNKVEQLVIKYQKISAKERKNYNEANTKNGFIQPLFEALDWDFSDINQVEAEKTIVTGRVDFICKLNGVSRFCLELKPLREELTDSDRKQAISYAYNKGVSWAILTNFDKLQVFNAERETNDVNNILFLNLTWKDYLPSFSELWLLSKESVASSQLDKQAERYGKLPLRIPIEKRLFQHLREYRERLFNEIYLFNKDKGITLAKTDSLIQELFNRLIFIRSAEDRNLAGNHPLLAALHRWKSNRKIELLDGVRGIFHRFSELYDSDLFPAGFDSWDQIWVIADTLSEFIGGLYEVPRDFAKYDFSAIDADVLGQVYEQYLGYVAQATKEQAKQQQLRLDLGIPVPEVIKLEEKREKRKASGIYYTPRWVTDYIVKQTVGRFLQERSYNEILNIKILDPACGSGSFLIRAYDELLSYHAKVKGIAVAELDWSERIAILTRNIFGVDLDRQAVEITKLNLLLRALAKAEALPSLANNIQCGNSLISGSEDELRQWFGDNFKDKKPFNWEDRFPDIMKQDRFDIVIGNPPYVRIQSLPREDADYYRSRFESSSGSFDIYVLFLEEGIKLLKPGGRLGFICSGKFLKSQYGKQIQQIIRREATVDTIVDLSVQTVFADATTYPALVILRRDKTNDPLKYIFVPGEIANSAISSFTVLAGLPAVTTDQASVTQGVWPPLAKDDPLLVKLSENTMPLGKLASKVFVGLQTSADAIYILEKRGELKGGLVRVYSKATGKEHELESALLKPLLTGKNINRYYTPQTNQLLLFPYNISGGKATLITESQFQISYPHVWTYLNLNRGLLEHREQGKFLGDNWYAFGRTQNLAIHEQPKLAIPRLVKRLEVFYDQQGGYYLDNVDVGGVILKEGGKEHYLYVLGLLHSRLLDFYFRRISAPFRGGFRSANRQFIEPLPIRLLDLSEPTQKRLQSELVTLVEKLLALYEGQAKTSRFDVEQSKQLALEIELTDIIIDNLVYELYGLTDSERQVIEASFPFK